MKLYNFLVNRHSGIRYRYHLAHDEATGMAKIWSWIYLLLLNIGFYVFRIKSLGKLPYEYVYEKKRIPTQDSESSLYRKKHPEISVENYVRILSKYDVISFDIFDTLIFRPLNKPTDLFHFVGEKLNILNFADIRSKAENEVRNNFLKEFGHSEVSLVDIWKHLEEKYGFDASKGYLSEIEVESNLCYANSFMFEVFKQLLEMKKTIIIVSDMYIDKDTLDKILVNAGYSGYSKLYVSNDLKRNKASGTLYDYVQKDYEGHKIIHVGDNPHSDIKMAQKHGFDTLYYHNINHTGQKYRTMDMSLLTGSAYRAMVNNRIYSGLSEYSMEYEYGYIYGGLFALGYCNFIHKYVLDNGLDSVLFLSRDGDILKQIYERFFPNENCKYVYWSRKVATKLLASENKNDFYKRFIGDKVNSGITIEKTFESMELTSILTDKDAWNKCCGKLSIKDKLLPGNVSLIKSFIEHKWNEVLDIYGKQEEGAKKYFEEVLKDLKKVAIVDIGWAGSGPMAIAHLVEDRWKMDCRVTGIIAGTNTMHNTEPDSSEAFLQSGKLVSYMFSQRENRDLLKKHDPNRNYNVYWELILSSPTPQFVGFSGEGQLIFGKRDYNEEGMKQIQEGILDFCGDYFDRFRNYNYMFRISGRDSYAPLLAASSYGEKYLRVIEEKFKFTIGVN